MAVRSFAYVKPLILQPERIAGGEYNVHSDMWSTGISLLEHVHNRFRTRVTCLPWKSFDDQVRRGRVSFVFVQEKSVLIPFPVSELEDIPD